MRKVVENSEEIVVIFVAIIATYFGTDKICNERCGWYIWLGVWVLLFIVIKIILDFVSRFIRGINGRDKK